MAVGQDTAVVTMIMNAPQVELPRDHVVSVGVYHAVLACTMACMISSSIVLLHAAISILTKFDDTVDAMCIKRND